MNRLSAFAGLAPQALQECVEGAVRRTLKKGEPVFHQGDRPARFHALLSGWVRILQAGADGELSVIRIVGAGELFGSFAMFSGNAYPADAIAAADGIELSWSETQFRQLMERYPAIAVNLVTIASQRLLELQERLREISTQPAERRIASALLRLARKGSKQHNDGRLEILLPLVRKDIAALAATTLYTASRTMAAWEREGIVASSARRISIRLPSDLRRIADGT